MESTDHRRVPYGAWVEKPDGADRGFYLAHSLSPVGLRLFADDPPRLGQEVQLRLLVENEQRVMEVEGEIVGHEFTEHERPNFAVRFTDLDEQDRDFLFSLFDESLGEAPDGALDASLEDALDEAL